jgi:hypothetical protein
MSGTETARYGTVSNLEVVLKAKQMPLFQAASVFMSLKYQES